MNLRRISKMLLAISTGQGVTIVGQLLVPPIFLARYHSGVEVYGEWIALSAAVSYLNTLNYGIQTYASNQMTILHNRDEIADAKAIQSNALRLLLLLSTIFGLGGLLVLWVPVGGWLNLVHTSNPSASMTIYLLVLSFIATMVLSLLINSFMVIGQAPRGTHWLNAQRMSASLALAICAWYRESMPVLAGSQLLASAVFTIFVLGDIRKLEPTLVPSFKFGSWTGVKPLVKPSVHFGFLSLSAFLIWQGPILLLQTVLGSSSVTIFSLSRTIFSMARQCLVIISYSVGPEITILVGKNDWSGLKRLYDLSESVVLFLVPVVSIGVLLFSPVLYEIWLHTRTLYVPALCWQMAVVSSVIGIKEHKYQFQSASNEHEKLAVFALVTYIGVLTGSLCLLAEFGITAFMFLWFAGECAQIAYISKQNAALFPPEIPFSYRPTIKLGSLLTVGFACSAWPAFASAQWAIPRVIWTAIAGTFVVTIGSYFWLDVGEVRSLLASQILKWRR